MVKEDYNDNNFLPRAHLREVINLKSWQKIQDNFSLVTNVGLRIVDAEGTMVTTATGTPRLCQELLKDSLSKHKMCSECLPTFLGGYGVVDKNMGFSCMAGLHNFITPLEIEKKVYGYIVMGPLILVMRRSKEQYRLVAEELNIDLEDFWSAIVELKVVSLQAAQSLLGLIKDTSDYILALSVENLKLKAQGFVAGASRIDKALQSLLEAAIRVSQADTGSVMFFDKAKEALTIRASKGLAQEIVANTQVRSGVGISGMAVQEKTAFLIDEEQSDNKIRPFLKRPQIKSSMVIPIKIGERALGVVNLGISQAKPAKFNAQSLKVVNTLVDLAAAVLDE